MGLKVTGSIWAGTGVKKQILYKYTDEFLLPLACPHFLYDLISDQSSSGNVNRNFFVSLNHGLAANNNDGTCSLQHLRARRVLQACRADLSCFSDLDDHSSFFIPESSLPPRLT